MTAHRVVVFGDSVPWGYGSRESYGWPELLSDYTERRLETYELGVSGERLVDLPNRVPEEIHPRAADMDGWETTVLIHTGHNDIQDADDGPQTDPEMFRIMVRRLEGLLENEYQVDRYGFVGLVPPITGRAIAVSEGEQERAEQYDSVLAETVDGQYVSLQSVDWEQHSADGIHPTHSGQKRIAEVVANAVL